MCNNFNFTFLKKYKNKVSTIFSSFLLQQKHKITSTKKHKTKTPGIKYESIVSWKKNKIASLYLPPAWAHQNPAIFDTKIISRADLWAFTSIFHHFLERENCARSSDYRGHSSGVNTAIWKQFFSEIIMNVEECKCSKKCPSIHPEKMRRRRSAVKCNAWFDNSTRHWRNSSERSVQLMLMEPPRDISSFLRPSSSLFLWNPIILQQKPQKSQFLMAAALHNHVRERKKQKS